MLERPFRDLAHRQRSRRRPAHVGDLSDSPNVGEQIRHASNLASAAVRPRHNEDVERPPAPAPPDVNAPVSRAVVWHAARVGSLRWFGGCSMTVQDGGWPWWFAGAGGSPTRVNVFVSPDALVITPDSNYRLTRIPRFLRGLDVDALDPEEIRDYLERHPVMLDPDRVARVTWRCGWVGLYGQYYRCDAIFKLLDGTTKTLFVPDNVRHELLVAALQDLYGDRFDYPLE